MIHMTDRSTFDSVKTKVEKSGALKRSFVGHEAAVNCMMITEGKLFTGSSDGTLRVWNAKDVSEELLVDDGPPPPAPVVVDADIEETTEDTPADAEDPAPAEEESPADDAEPTEEEAAAADEVQDIEEEEAPAEEEPAKEVEDEMDEMEQELAAQG